MLTKAAKQAICTFASWNKSENAASSIAMFPNDSIRTTQNQERWISALDGALISTTSVVTNVAYPGFSIGSGTTPPTENDYNLESTITSGFTMVLSGSTRGIDSNGKFYMEFNFTITNTSGASMTVSEICLKTANARACSSPSATTATGTNIMVDRTLLTTPVTIANSGSASIKYRITSDMSFA